MAFNKERFFAQINAIYPQRYDITMAELCAIYDEHHHSPCAMAFDGFRYGFLKGQRAAQAEMKRKQKARVAE